MSILCHISVSDHHRRLSSSTSSDSPSIDLKFQSNLLKKSHAIDKILHQLYDMTHMIQSISNQKHSTTILYKHFAQDIISIQFIHQEKWQKNMTVQTNQGTLDMWDCFPKLECFESVCPRPSAPGRFESRNGPRCLLQRPPPGGFQGLGGGALGGGYRCLDHLTNPFPYHPNHSPMFPQWELPACPSSGSWDLKSGTSALRIPISIRNHCKGAPVAKAAPK